MLFSGAPDFASQPLVAATSILPTPAPLTAPPQGALLSVQFTDLPSGRVNNISWQFPGDAHHLDQFFPTVTYNSGDF